MRLLSVSEYIYYPYFQHFSGQVKPNNFENS